MEFYSQRNLRTKNGRTTNRCSLASVPSVPITSFVGTAERTRVFPASQTLLGPFDWPWALPREQVSLRAIQSRGLQPFQPLLVSTWDVDVITVSDVSDSATPMRAAASPRVGVSSFVWLQLRRFHSKHKPNPRHMPHRTIVTHNDFSRRSARGVETSPPTPQPGESSRFLNFVHYLPSLSSSNPTHPFRQTERERQRDKEKSSMPVSRVYPNEHTAVNLSRNEARPDANESKFFANGARWKSFETLESALMKKFKAPFLFERFASRFASACFLVREHHRHTSSPVEVLPHARVPIDALLNTSLYYAITGLIASR